MIARYSVDEGLSVEGFVIFDKTVSRDLVIKMCEEFCEYASSETEDISIRLALRMHYDGGFCISFVCNLGEDGKKDWFDLSVSLKDVIETIADELKSRMDVDLNASGFPEGVSNISASPVLAIFSKDGQ